MERQKYEYDYLLGVSVCDEPGDELRREGYGGIDDGDEGGGGERQAHVRELGREVYGEGDDGHARRQMHHRERPESPRFERLPGGELRLVGVRRLGRARAAGEVGAVSVRSQAHVFGTVANRLPNGSDDDEQEDADSQRSPSEAVIVHAIRERPEHESAEVDAGHGGGDGERALAYKPVVHQTDHRQPAAQPGSERNHHERGVELQQAVDAGEHDEADGHDDVANENHPPIAETVYEPSFGGSEYGAFAPRQRERERHLGALPAEMPFERDKERPKPLKDRHRHERQHENGNAHQLPSVEDGFIACYQVGGFE